MQDASRGFAPLERWRCVIALAAFAVGCGQDAPASATSAGNTTTAPVEARGPEQHLEVTARPLVSCDTLSNIPHQQTEFEAYSLMDGASPTQLRFDAYPALGVWVHEIFIKQDRVALPPAEPLLQLLTPPLAQLGLAALNLFGDGDGREHQVDFDPRNTRAFIVLDFETGTGYLLSNNSIIYVEPKIGPGGLQYTFKARPVPHVWKGEDGDWGADSWVFAEWVDKDTFRIRYHLLENVWFSDIAAAISDVIAPIDAQLLIKRDGQFVLEHDNFPSYGTYQYAPCASSPTQRSLVHQQNLADLNNDTHFSYDARFGAVPRLESVPNADPSVIRVGETYYSVESDGGAIYSRTAASPEALPETQRRRIWTDTGMGEIWAPELMMIDDRYYVYFSAGAGAAHRMYVISSSAPANGYGAAQRLALPDDKWAVDGTAFNFNNQLWFVWSGWAGTTNVEQNLYIARMSNPTTPTGGRFIISQPREGWERAVGNPFINEAPEAIKDPNGQLHIVYSANGSWSDQYCIADLRLRADGDPTYVWDWYKSNGCLFGSNAGTMMPGFPTTQSVNGPGHHSFVLLNGDINTSPPAGSKFPLMYHGVPKGVDYTWGNRRWYAGGFGWWANITYGRSNVPGANLDTGYSLGLFENPRGPMPPPPATAAPGQTTIHNQDPSVIRVGSTYYSVESNGNNIYVRSASGVAGLSGSQRTLIWSSPKNMPNVWAPELVTMPTAFGPIYVIYFASGDGGASQRMYLTWSGSPDRGYSNPERLNLPDDKWAVDGTAFNFNNQLWFVWSGWEGNTNVEQNLYIARMNSFFEVIGPRFIISQPREGWERVVGNPFINESPEAIKDPSGQLHIVYSANGSWSDQYCIADLRLRAGGDPTYVWDWYKSNGCLFGSNRGTMMNGWDPTLYVNGPGHQSFVLLNGDIGTSPPAGPTFPLMFHAVPKNVSYKWENRLWYFGSFCWWGNITYSRRNVPGDNNNTGWSLKLFE